MPDLGSSPIGDDVLEQVEKVIKAIRPAIQADEGDIELVSVDEATGVVTVELMGACVTCPASTQTLKAGIERIMKDRVEGVTEVLEVNALGMSESPVQRCRPGRASPTTSTTVRRGRRDAARSR